MTVVDKGEAEPAGGNLSDKLALIYATFPTVEAAEEAADRLLSQHLIACANIFPPMTAIYEWEGQRHRDSEVAVLFKTQIACREHVIAAIASHHPFHNPAILALDCAQSTTAYARWIASATLPRPAQTGH